MKVHHLHSWDVTPAEAVALQRELAGQVDTRSLPARYELIAGADVSYSRFSNTLYAGVVIVRAEDLTVVEKQGAVFETMFPYVPGLLSFRETPALLEVFKRLKTEPDVIMVDGQGLAHPRRMGFACHVGLCLDRPTVGCAKSLLLGRHRNLGKRPGATAALTDGGEVIGKVVRTKFGVKPLFVSCGHRIDLAAAVRLVLATCRGYRLPEPTRQAHLHVNALRQACRERSTCGTLSRSASYN